jgi:hypothetical protein
VASSIGWHRHLPFVAADVQVHVDVSAVSQGV